MTKREEDDSVWASAAWICICLLQLLQGRHRQPQWEEQQEEEEWGGEHEKRRGWRLS